MEFLFGAVCGAVVWYLFNNPEKTKQLKEDINKKIEQHKE